MIGVFVVDDHPALRTGVAMVVSSEPGLEFVGAAADAETALATVADLRPDVVLVDYRLPSENGLVLCHEVKELDPAPRVVVYSAFPDAALGVPATAAGADGVVCKTAAPDELLDAIRSVARGRPVLPPATPERIRACAGKLEVEDVPIFGMLMDRTPHAEIASTLGLDSRTLARRVSALLSRLGVDGVSARAA